MLRIKIFETRNGSRARVKALFGLLMCSLLAGCQTMGKAESDEILKAADPVQTIAELLRDGDAAVSQNKIDLAKIKYALVLEQDKENIDAMFKLGVVHGHSGALSVAEGLLRRVYTLNPEHLDAREELGLVLLKEKQLKEAEVLLEEALEARPGSTKVLNAMGIIKDLKAEHGEAQSLFLAALYITPDSAKIQNNLGYSYYLAGEYDNAEKHMRNATDITADYAQAWSNLGLLYSRQGRYPESRSAFRKVVNEHKTANNMGYLGILQENEEVARKELKKAVSLSPAYYEIANENLVVLGRPRNSSGIPPEARTDAKEQAPVRSGRALTRLVVGKRATNGNLSVLQTQAYLNYLGYPAGMEDGKSGRQTRKALRQFQSSNSIPMTGKNTVYTQRRLEKAVVVKVQKTLNMLGYDAGSADGLAGRATINAVNGFRKKRAMPVNGQIDDVLLESLRESLSQNLEELSDPDALDISARG